MNGAVFVHEKSNEEPCPVLYKEKGWAHCSQLQVVPQLFPDCSADKVV